MDMLVLGLDGMEPSLVQEWEDDLPALSKLINNGGFGLLRSSDPPLSSPAWQWMFTGKQGGKNSIFGFTRQESDSYERAPVNLDDVKSETLWGVLDAEGISCGVVNVPETYPPADLEHGFMISGWPIPNRVNPANPPSIIDNLKQELGEPYQVNPMPMGPELKDFPSQHIYESLCDAIDHHERAFKTLIEQHSVEIFFGVFTATDIAGHYLAWDKDRLHDLYVRQDEAVASLLEAAPSDTDVIVMSDHGHAAKGESNFHVNEWLIKEGYLKRLSDDSANSIGKNLLRTVGITQRNVLRVKNALGFDNPRQILPQPIFNLAKQLIPPEDERSEGIDPETIDWSQTSAFTGPEQNIIFFNTENAHPEGMLSSEEKNEVRDEIVEKLLDLQHPDRNGQLVSDLKTDDEVFDGPFANQAPGIIFICDEMRCAVLPGLNDGEVFSRKQHGEHRPNGLLLTEGPSFANDDNLENRSILDIFPLVLALAGVNIPKDVDGSIPQDRLEEPLNPTYRKSRDETFGRSEYSEEENEEVKEQLRGLGYLD